MNSVQRITNLDFIRGFALLGILVINVIAFGLPLTATTNQSTYGIDNTLDWIVLVISSCDTSKKTESISIGTKETEVIETVSNSVTTVQEVLGDMMGDAPACYDCGHITIRNGSCYKCLNCGNSLGCS